jgi:hypothetical protein
MQAAFRKFGQSCDHKKMSRLQDATSPQRYPGDVQRQKSQSFDWLFNFITTT